MKSGIEKRCSERVRGDSAIERRQEPRAAVEKETCIHMYKRKGWWSFTT